MEFKEKKSIYRQIAESFTANILRGEWKAEHRIPSVREMAVQLEVNPNTVQRAYAWLQERGVIYNKRGIGYFVSDQADKEVKHMKKEEFLKQELPDFFRTVQLLDIDFDELKTHYKNFLEGDKENENKH